LFFHCIHAFSTKVATSKVTVTSAERPQCDVCGETTEQSVRLPAKCRTTLKKSNEEFKDKALDLFFFFLEMRSESSSPLVF
jgi:hypothetical protein